MPIAFTTQAETLWGVAQCMGVVSKLGCVPLLSTVLPSLLIVLQ